MKSLIFYKRAYLNIYHEGQWLFAQGFCKEELDAIIARKYFKPKEDAALKHWFAQFLTLRASLKEIIGDIELYFKSDVNNVKSKEDWRLLIVGYASACLVISLDRQLIAGFAYHKTIQRKLNEEAKEYQIRRKSFSRLYRALTSPSNAIMLRYVRDFMRAKQIEVSSFAASDTIAEVVATLSDVEKSIAIDELSYLKYRLNYRLYALKRRWLSVKHKTLFKILEVSGRILSEMVLPKTKRVTVEIVDQVEQILQPGDVIVSRHDYVASNYLLPGFWPHCALYVGNEGHRQDLGIEVLERHEALWRDKVDTLEAIKDGVRLKSLSEMLQVDNFVIIRPQVTNAEVKQALEQILPHEGKKYNFDFDFFRSDRLVCTEVIYRAFDGVGEMVFDLVERAGRYTLSAEDILDMALNGKHFTPIAIFGYGSSHGKICQEAETVRELLFKSYKV